jgi:hypothetical protein
MGRVGWLVASLFFGIPLAGGWSSSEISGTGAYVLAGAAAVVLVRPAWGLLIMCGLIPMAGPLSIAAHSPRLFEQLVLAFLAAAAFRLALDPAAARGRLTRPAVLLGLLVLVSGSLAISLVQQQTYASVRPFLGAAWTQFAARYYADTPHGGIMVRLMNWVEALALAAVAERLVRRDPHIGRSAVRLLLLSGGALAFFWVNRLLEIGAASPRPLDAMVQALLHRRFNPLYRDINAAASVLTVFLAPALWIVWRQRQAWAAGAAGLLTLAVWLAGSRAAFASVVAALGLAWMRLARPRRRTVLLAAVAAVAAVAIVSAASGRNASVRSATIVRLELYRVAAKLTIANPVFGTGLDSFRQRSAPIISPTLRAFFPHFFASGENAHNNFLQILAELGLFGFAAFAWLVLPVLRGTWQRLSSPAVDGWEPALGLGIAAFLGTCLLGHPLLLDDVRWQFFFVVGVATAMASAPPAPMRPAARGLYAAALVFAAGSAPMRLSAERRTANLDGVIIGTSERHQAPDDGVPYRLVWTDGTWYLGASTHAVSLRVRADDVSEEPCAATLAIDGRMADTLSPGRDAWTNLLYQLDSTRSGASRRIDVHVVGPQCRVMVSDLIEIR